jgi:hypothetical protein
VLRWARHGAIGLAVIVAKYWTQYVAWKKGRVRRGVFFRVRQMLACRTAKLGVTLYICPGCETVRVVPHSCKSVACPSCGTVRTDAWCAELLSDILNVGYRHLVFTLPWQLRLPIFDNRKRLLDVLFRAARDAILSLTSGSPAPLGNAARKWLEGRKSRAWRRGRGWRRPLFVPGMIVVLHTFGSDLKWNPHLHVIVTAGGLSCDGRRWVKAPKRYLVPAPLLGTEWKLRVIRGVADAHRAQELHCRRLRSDRRRRINIRAMLGCVRKKRWHINIGQTLATADGAVRYACRYTKRPVLAEGRILGLSKDGKVTYRYKDYYRGGATAIRTLPALEFLDTVFQHFPDERFRQVRHYGIFSTRCRSTALPTARQLLAQRKKRRPSPPTWEQRRKAVGNRRPLSCPRCGRQLLLWCLLFGSPEGVALLLKLGSSEDRIPPETFTTGADVRSSLVRGPPLKCVVPAHTWGSNGD